MPTASFPSLATAEVVEVEIQTTTGSYRSLKLLVDSGFTGQSSLILGANATDLVRAATAPAQVAGALRGEQNRGWVTCRVDTVGFQQTVIAILTDLSPLSLPPGVEGLAGLRFLRHFDRWGAEQLAGNWRFFLGIGPV